MKKKSKATRILEHIQNTNKLTHKKLVTFICNMNGREYQNGYYGDALSTFRHKGLIRTNKYGYYKLTQLGKKNINNPYKKTIDEKIKDEAYELYCEYKGRISFHDIPRINYVKKSECYEAIEYLFENGFVDEMTRDKRHYTTILLKAVANMLKIELIFD